MSLLNVRNLRTYFFTLEGVVKAVDGVDINLEKGETLGLVGESGCGKSTFGYSVMRLVPYPGRIVDGEIILERDDLLKKSNEEMRNIRGSKIAMIFQNPITALNPVFTIEDQIGEAFKIHQNIKSDEVGEKVSKILEEVGIPDPSKRMKDYPHQFSGGMAQRAMIAMALSCNPSVLIADEPTTNLDVTIQAQIMELMERLREQVSSSIMLITHDLGLVAEICDKVVVMYAGKIVEKADIMTLFREPGHPYTKALMRAVPGYEELAEELNVIKGSVPDLISPPSGCRFHPRCDFATDGCARQEPEPVLINDGHIVYCLRVDEIS